MKRTFSKSGFFLKLFMVLLAIGWSTSTMRAEYWRLHIKAIHRDGTGAASYVAMEGSAPTATMSEYTMESASSSIYVWKTNPHKAQIYVAIQENNHEKFIGWYTDEACTVLLADIKTGSMYADPAKVPIYGTSGEADNHIQTIYALFSDPINWSDLVTSGPTPQPAGDKYYIYNVGFGGFLSNTAGTTIKAFTDVTKAQLFTLTPANGDSTQITTIINGTKYYLKKTGIGFQNSADWPARIKDYGGGVCQVGTTTSKKVSGQTVYIPALWYVNTSGGITNNKNQTLDNYCDDDFYNWLFIPEQTYLNQIQVKKVAQEDKNRDINIPAESPNGEDSVHVHFVVSGVGHADDFDCYFSNDTQDRDHWRLDEKNRNGNPVNVSVFYHAHGIPGDYVAKVVLASKAETPTRDTIIVTAHVSEYTPVCEMTVGSTLDWSTKEVGEEIYNVGMEVAASQRERLQHKLVYSGNNDFIRTTATWKATITGTNANQFKFATGKRDTIGTYSPELLDVIYAPTASSGEGVHEATLTVKVGYERAANDTVWSANKTVTLRGKATDNSMLTMAVNGSETASNNESYNFGEIIGTNSDAATIDLYLHNMGNSLTAEWSDPDGVFDEFDVSTIDFAKTYQRFVITAHPTTPVTENTNYSATLTIKSTGTTVGTLTLQFTATPLLTADKPTWNWAELYEDATYANPITTYPGAVWTLEQRDGNGGMTYHPEDTTITTEYMHHQDGYTATFECNLAQSATYAARTDTFTARINANIPPVIEINSEAKFNTYVEHNNSYVEWVESNKSVHTVYEDVYFKWSGQSTLTFDFYRVAAGEINYNDWSITEMYEDGTENTTYPAYRFVNGQHYEIPVSTKTFKLRMHGSNYLENVRYFEYDTIMAEDQTAEVTAAIFVANYDGSSYNDESNKTDIVATFANKRAVTISLSAAAQPFFELRAEGKATGSSLVYNEADGLGVHKTVKNKVFTVAFKEGVDFDEARAAVVNGFEVILQDNYTYNSETLILPIALEASYDVTYKYDANGSYNVTYHDDLENPHSVAAEDYSHHVASISVNSCTATLSEPVPASGYMFRGWKLNGELVSCKANYTLIPASGATVEPIFVETEEAVYGIDDARFADLDEALSTAGSIAASKPVVVVLKDVTLSEPATHTIPAGVTLLIPYKDNFSELQSIPEITTTATVLSAYRTLTLKEGVNIVVNGNICVSAKIMAAGGGNKSAYPTGECGVINMANGGHIELNDGAHLYCWGYIKGQDMDQGNNTQNVGTITVNAGAIVHEDFELGDWRGGTASSDIYYQKEEKMLFPFQSYALQNVEIPTTYTYGSRLVTFMAVNTGFGSIPFSVSMIGSAETLFLLKDAGSVIRKWYDPTTDLTCYELSGTAQLDALVMNLPFVGDFNSGDCNLPVSNSMHIILADCNMTLSKPLTVQAGAVVEIKSTAAIDLTAKIHLFDNDQWDKYIHNYYFRSFNNLTSHKNRGAENSKDGLEDAKFIIDGTLNVKSGQGYIYSTAGGANLMGNGGGKIVFEGALPAAGNLWHVTVLNAKPYITWVPTPEAAANLCNEDGSYTRSITGASFYNIHGRWFHEDDKEALEDHTYAFTYMIDDNQENDPVVNAVYSHDKTGLEERMKWFNVAEDGCANWWTGTNPEAYYNYTMLSDWHQFIETETENVYSGSNNVLYRKADCDWAEEGYIDENCLYTIGGVKKALVDGHFIPLTSNGYDPAYHATANASQYYICFTGCNWHPATPYVGESKAYTIHPEDEDLHYIWFNNDWLNVLRDEPFFYTEDEQTNVRTYYAYVNGEWEVATPYVSVSDAAETRTFYMIKEAFNVASIKKDATITLLRDIPNVTEVLTYTTQNTNCTLDLNGHLLAGNIANLITVNAPGATFTITDNAALKSGKISNAANKAVYVQKGTLVVTDGIIETTAASANAIEGAASTTININGGYFAATSKCVHTAGTCAISGGYFNKEANLVAYAAEHKYPFETTDPKYKWVVEDAWTITFKNGETVLQTLHLHPGETPVYTENQPTNDNQKFTGWDPAIADATADAIYQAQFTPITEGSKCVTLNSNGGNEGLQYIYVTSGDPVGTLPTATKDGYSFAGWFTEASAGTQVSASTTVSADVTWYAHYTVNHYTLTWDANGGELSGSYTSGDVNFGASIIAPTATLAGHTLLGWTPAVANTMPAANTTYTAQWSIVAKHYLQNIDGTYPETPEATENVSGEIGAYVTPAVKTYDGFLSPETQTVQIGAVTEVTYNYARRTYTITLDANGGTCATTSLTVKHGATLTLPVATKNGVDCSGWFTKAIGGDQVTNETEILYNIGTLYAQYADLNVTAPLTVSDTREVSDLRITTTGSLTINGSVTTNNFILESNGSTASGQLLPGTGTLTIAGNAYFDLKLNAKNHQWYAVAVPWPVNATSGVSVNGKTLELGKDFDIIYYDGARRATEGKQKCWSYVEEDGEKTLVPGRLYMIGLMSDAATVRFEKTTGALSTTTTSVAAHASTTGDETDKGWNGVANPALFHAFVNPGVTEGQVYVPDQKRYETVTLNTTKFVVGEGAFVQVESDKNITVVKDGAFAAPRRTRAQANLTYDVRIAPAEGAYTDRLFIKTTDSREADAYTVGQDLAKVSVSSIVPQMWINRYNAKLCVNTAEVINETAEYPLGINIPKTGEYTISQEVIGEADNYTLYLTYNDEVVWNLTHGAYTTSLPQGEVTGYGLRIIAKTPAVATGMDEALIDAQGNTRKVLIDNKVYIIRGNNVYSADGQLVK